MKITMIALLLLLCSCQAQSQTKKLNISFTHNYKTLQGSDILFGDLNFDMKLVSNSGEISIVSDWQPTALGDTIRFETQPIAIENTLYRVWVRAVRVGADPSAWTKSDEFEIKAEPAQPVQFLIAVPVE